MTRLGRYDLTPLFSPRSIAIVGASPREGSRGRAVLDNLIGLGYPGKIYLVNPRYETIGKTQCYGSMRDLPEAVDAAAICVPHTGVLSVVRECHAAGTRSVAVVASGFAEAGGQGIALQRELAEFARSVELPLAGPNGLAIFNAHDRVAYWHSPPCTMPTTGLAAVMQSGALIFAVAEVAAERGIRFGCIASTGNEAVLSAADYIEHMADDSRISLIALLLETVNNPEQFVRAAKMVQDNRKPLIALKIGRSQRGQQAALAHTGSMAGSDAVVETVFRQAGVIRVGDLDEFIETVGVFAQGRLPRRGRVAFSGVSGAAAGLVADTAEQHGLALANLAPETIARIETAMPRVRVQNPLDISRAGDEPGLYKTCFSLLAGDPEVDVLAVGLNVPQASDEWGRAFYLDQAQAALQVWRDYPDKVVVVFSYSSGGFDPVIRSLLKGEGMIPLLGLRESILAVKHLVQFAKNAGRTSLLGHKAEATGTDYGAVRRRLRESPQIMGERESKDLLRACGIPVPKECMASTLGEALASAAQLGYPVAVKVASPDILHKTESGGVALGINSPEELERAFERVVSGAQRHYPDARIHGALIQEMVPAGLELIVGLKRDPQFGPILMVGLGGTYTEVFHDVVLRVPPVSAADAETMLKELRCYPILQGTRGQPKADLASLIDVIVRVGDLGAQLGDEIRELDVNPLVVHKDGEGVHAVDALLIRSDTSPTSKQ